MRVKIRDTAFGGGMLLISGLFWLETRKSQYQVAKEQDYGFDPAFFPRILLLLWALLSAVIILRALVSETEEVEAPLWHRFVYAVALTAFYMLAMNYIGFLFASIPYTAAFMLVFGYRHRVIMPLVAVVFPTVTWWIFVFPLHIPLPVSPWFTRL